MKLKYTLKFKVLLLLSFMPSIALYALSPEEQKIFDYDATHPLPPTAFSTPGQSASVASDTDARLQKQSPFLDQYPFQYEVFENEQYTKKIVFAPSASMDFYSESLEQMERTDRNYLILIDSSGSGEMSKPVEIKMLGNKGNIPSRRLK